MPDVLPIDDPPPIGERLREARRLAGLSTRAVADALAGRFKVSHATIGNFERGVGSPSVELLSLLAALYERPFGWFLERGPSFSGIHYRDLPSKVSKSERARFEDKCLQWACAYTKTERFLGKPLKPSYDEFTADVQALKTGKSAAEWFRARLALKTSDPVWSIAELLAKLGIRALEQPTEIAVDGFAAQLDGEPVVILNPTTAYDRARMNAGHEMAHVLFGDCVGGTEPSKAAETRAYEFSSHLLMPEPQLEEAFRGQSMVKLVRAKEKFGISLAAMIMRASRSGYITEAQTKMFWIEFSKRGWRRVEPGQVRPDRATRFESLLDEAVEGRQAFTWSGMASFLGVKEEELLQRRRYAIDDLCIEPKEVGSDSTIPIR